jgi:hypothetical protein
MPYVPRPATTASCAHCGTSYESRHLRRKYCSNSCNVLASYERNGRNVSTRPTKADLEQMLATLIKLVNPKPKPAAKAAATPTGKKTAPKPTKPAPALVSVEKAPYEVYRRGPGTSGPDKTELEMAQAKVRFHLAALAQAKTEARKK